MLIPSNSTFKGEDFPTEQSWITKLLQPLNAFMSDVVQAINGNLTFGDNIPGQTIQMQFVYSAATDFPKLVKWNLPNGVNPVEVRVCKATEDGIPIAVAIAWSFGNGNLTFSNIMKLTASGVTTLSKGSSYNITLRGQP